MRCLVKAENKKIIQSWLLVERLKAGELPELDRQRQLFKEGTVDVTGFTNIASGNSSYLYFGVYPSEQIKDVVARYFKESAIPVMAEEVLYYTLACQLDDKGNYISNSLVIPDNQFMLQELLTKEKINLTFENIVAASQRAKEMIEPELVAIFKSGISKEALTKTNKMIKKHFNYQWLKDKVYSIPNVSIKNQPIETNQGLINDLSDILASQENSFVLENYLTGKADFTEISHNLELLNSILKLNNIPDGRWPSTINHKLNMMQQVAVNLVLNENKAIHAINTPPGTGKMTVLKDIIAGLVVQRAEKMVTFKEPEDAFEHLGMIDIKGETLHRYELSSLLKGYGVVVATEDEEAALGLTKKLGKGQEIIHGIDRFAPGEQSYGELVREMNLFPEYVRYLVEKAPNSSRQHLLNDYWGLFSLPLGKAELTNQVFERMLGGLTLEDGTDVHSLYQQLKNEGFIQRNWEQACGDFAATKAEIVAEEAKIKRHWEVTEQIGPLAAKVKVAEENTREAISLMAENTRGLEKNLNRLKDVQEKIRLLPKPTWFKQLIWKITGKKNELLAHYHSEISELTKQKAMFELVRVNLVKKIEELEYNQKMAKSEFASARHFSRSLGLHFEKNEYQTIKSDRHREETERQKTVPWLTKKLNYLRGKYFIQGLVIHKLFNQSNSTKIYSALTVLKKRQQLNLDNPKEQALLLESWKIFHLLIPVVSTNLASLGELYAGLGPGSIDYLLIEQGNNQSPQAGVGGMWRAKQVVVLGDESQEFPVKLFSDTLFKNVAATNKLTSSYLSATSSLQHLASLASAYGTTKTTGQRLGIPLWVQRRCLNPMFEITNQLSYEGKLIQGVPAIIAKQGQVSWIDSQGVAIKEQYVLEQSEALLNALTHTKRLQDILVLTPFKTVAEETRNYLRQHAEAFSHYSIKEVEGWLEESVGTVANLQTKGRSSLYFICGTDEKNDEDANWSCQDSNLLTMAISQAKKELVMIGDYQRFKEKAYYQVIANRTQKIISK